MEFSVVLIFLLGVVLGSLATYAFLRQRSHLLQSSQSDMKDAFARLSVDALQTTTDQFLKLANETLRGQAKSGEAVLDEKKKLIDANLKHMAEVVEDLKKQSVVLKTQLSENRKETEKLRGTTDDLRSILSSSQARGQWGERMVEDILAVIGLVENVNYVKQRQVESGEKPDYTFFLPKEKLVNMDVKFPLTHYERLIAADGMPEQELERKMFLDDVKGHIKDVASRQYINPSEGTVDYVLLFIPNESIYAFIHQSDPDILEMALEMHILLCSPITLYAVLSLIHQAVENFAMEEKAGEIMSLLREFERQWERFVGSMDKMGRSIEATRKEFEHLTSTRSRQLEKPLRKIKEIEVGLDVDIELLPENPPDES